MGIVSRKLTRTFKDFFESETVSGVLLVAATVVSLLMANSGLGERYLHVWHMDAGGLSLSHWVNDALMAVFFLLIGLELERELYSGELSSWKNALLPMVAAIGGILVPAAIHFTLNAGTATQPGMGIPMATDIAFALGALAILGNRVPASLKVFVVAFAVMDDLFAIIVIALFYTDGLSLPHFAGALAVWALLLFGVNRRLRVMALWPYLLGGALMWYLMLRSGVHATLAGVLLAFAIPFSSKEDDSESPSHRLEHGLHRPVAFFILPLFALANTGIVVGPDWARSLASANSLGILTGLIVGKPVGITVACFLAVKAGICRLPLDLGWNHVVGAGLLGGIGFTISIFITNLAFSGSTEIVGASKMAILLASLTAGTLGLLWLSRFGLPKASDVDLDTMDFHEDEPSMG